MSLAVRRLSTLIVSQDDEAQVWKHACMLRVLTDCRATDGLILLAAAIHPVLGRGILVDVKPLFARRHAHHPRCSRLGLPGQLRDRFRFSSPRRRPVQVSAILQALGRGRLFADDSRGGYGTVGRCAVLGRQRCVGNRSHLDPHVAEIQRVHEDSLITGRDRPTLSKTLAQLECQASKARQFHP